MRKRRRQAQPKRVIALEPAPAIEPAPVSETQVFTGGVSLHELFQQQVRQTLDQSDLDEDAKQAILVALSCPCCGTGGMNYTAKINRKK